MCSFFKLPGHSPSECLLKSVRLPARSGKHGRAKWVSPTAVLSRLDPLPSMGADCTTEQLAGMEPKRNMHEHMYSVRVYFTGVCVSVGTVVTCRFTHIYVLKLFVCGLFS